MEYEVMEEEEEEVWNEVEEEEAWNEEEEGEEAAAAQKPKKKRYRRPLMQAEKDITATIAKAKRQWKIDNIPGFLANEFKQTSVCVFISVKSGWVG